MFRKEEAGIILGDGHFCSGSGKSLLEDRLFLKASFKRSMRFLSELREVLRRGFH
jgi:hypothetical protein